ncbi:Band 4.1-like protein 2 [Acipenser ruthenus]|uniref:Band 4.1-like protein 2 n=1 Tax=Acipenser ruthenus TaxID=7906 RepID=A0A444UCH1_ACIRT|nr:Band 4.1-like protein 2 [Acipenser ruthenus]
MTTETGSETEVKKHLEQTEEEPAAPEQQTQVQDEPALQQQVYPKEYTGAEKTEEQTNNKETLQSATAEQPSGEEHTDTPPSPKPASPSVQTSPGLIKKEKEQAAGKGISRFLPPWLKKQKSQSQVEPKESLGSEDRVKEEGDVQEKSEEEGGEKASGREDGVDKPAEDQRSLPQDSKADEKEEKHSVSSAKTQPAKEETRKDTLEKDVDLEEEEDKNGAGEAIQKKIEEEKVQKPELKAEKPHKKMKTVVCKVMMLEGTEFPCEVEVTDPLPLPTLYLTETEVTAPVPTLYCTSTDPVLKSPNWYRPGAKVTKLVLTQSQTVPKPPNWYRTGLVLTRGLTPAQADAQFLENAKKLSMYGVDLHHAKDSEGVDIMLGICANGLLIYKDKLRINRFAWPKILKISYKRSNFYIKVRPGETEQFESTIGFKLANHRAAKRLWKVCVEHHTFFRLVSPDQPPKAKFLTLGSKFRYSGRTQAQTRQASTLIDRPAPYFKRTSSNRVSRSLDGAPVASVTDHSLVDSFVAEINGKGDAADKDNAEEPGKPFRTQMELSQESKDLDKTQEEVLKHHASICELKRSFMESTPEPRPSQWEKRLTTTLPPMTLGTSDEKQKSKMGEEVEVVIEETVIEEIRRTPKLKNSPDTTKNPAAAVPSGEGEKEKALEEQDSKASTSSDSHSESEDEAEYHPQLVKVAVDQIREEPEENDEELGKESQLPTEHPAEEILLPPPPEVQGVADEEKQECKGHGEDEAPSSPAENKTEQEAEKTEEPKVNGEESRSVSEVIPQPPVVKTEIVTISDTFAAQKKDISTTEVPIVHTETKTITYEASQSVKGGLSETRIEKRIVITGDADIDHDQALAQAIKEAKEQHPDMSVTRVVVHKETELAEDGED